MLHGVRLITPDQFPSVLKQQLAAIAKRRLDARLKATSASEIKVIIVADHGISSASLKPWLTHCKEAGFKSFELQSRQLNAMKVGLLHLKLIVQVGFERDANGKAQTDKPTLYVDGQKVAIDEFWFHLDQICQKPRSENHATIDNSEIEVQADREVPYALLKKLISTCNDVGFSKIKIRSSE